MLPCQQVNSNGYVAMGTLYGGRNPAYFDDLFNKRKARTAQRKGFALFAPLWADSDLRRQGSVFIHRYEKTDTQSSRLAYDRIRHVLALATYDVATYGGLNDFEATFVLVVTWNGMVPRRSYEPEFDQVSVIMLQADLLVTGEMFKLLKKIKSFFQL